MVAPVSEGQRLTLRESEFVREYVKTGGKAAEAYRRAFRYSGPNATELAVRITSRAHVKQAIAELADAARAEGAMDMRERRAFLARVVRDKRRFPSPDAGTRINALREDAILAGERRQDGTQVNVGVVVSLGDVLGGLGGARGLLGAVTQSPVVVESRPVEAMEAPAAVVTPPAPPMAAESPHSGLLGLLGPSSRPAVVPSPRPAAVAEWSDE